MPRETVGREPEARETGRHQMTDHVLPDFIERMETALAGDSHLLAEALRGAAYALQERADDIEWLSKVDHG